MAGYGDDTAIQGAIECFEKAMEAFAEGEPIESSSLGYHFQFMETHPEYFPKLALYRGFKEIVDARRRRITILREIVIHLESDDDYDLTKAAKRIAELEARPARPISLNLQREVADKAGLIQAKAGQLGLLFDFVKLL